MVTGWIGLDSASPIFFWVRGWRQVLLTRLRRTTSEGSADDEEEELVGSRATLSFFYFSLKGLSVVVYTVMDGMEYVRYVYTAG